MNNQSRLTYCIEKGVPLLVPIMESNIFASLTKKLYLIGGRELAGGIRLPPNTEIIDSTGSGLEKNWVIIVLAQDEGCGLIAEEFEARRYRGFFTTNRNLVIRCKGVLKGLLSIKEADIYK